MTILAALALVVMTLQEPAPAAATEQGARPTSSSTAVSTIASRRPPPANAQTRTVCAWERATGSTMSRRVCRDVLVNSSQRDQSSNEALRQMQGSRYGERPQ